MFGGLDVSAAELAVCFVAAAGGAVIQGVIGFGYALLVVPALLLVAPGAVPVAPLVVALPMVIVLSVADRGSLDRAGFARLTAGRLPGTVVGAVVIGAISTRALGGAAGALLLLAVALSTARGVRRTSPRVEVIAGFASGIAGTVGAVGGPYLGLAYADRAGPVMRATVSAAFAVGVALSLAAIAVAGRLHHDPVLLGVALVPATFAGLAVGRRLGLDRQPALLRPAVLVVAGCAGLFALGRALL